MSRDLHECKDCLRLDDDGLTMDAFFLIPQIDQIGKNVASTGWFGI